MSALTTERLTAPKDRGLSSIDSYTPRAFLQFDPGLITSSNGPNVPACGAWSIGSYSLSSVTQSAYQKPESNLSPLSPELAARLNELSLLKNGWDEGDALQINSEAVKAARNVLRRLSLVRPFQGPSIVPTFDGFLQLEWHNTFRSLEFEYTPEKWSVLGVDSVDKEQPNLQHRISAFDGSGGFGAVLHLVLN